MLRTTPRSEAHAYQLMRRELKRQHNRAQWSQQRYAELAKDLRMPPASREAYILESQYYQMRASMTASLLRYSRVPSNA